MLSPNSLDDIKGSDTDSDGNPRFKTEICRNYKEKGHCLYGNDCQFAHGSYELKDGGKQNKYKTKLCQKYWIAGYCAYGPRCNFVHCDDKGSAGDVSGESLEWSSPSSPTIPPLSAMHRPSCGSGRMAAFMDKDKLTWVDTWTKKIV